MTVTSNRNLTLASILAYLALLSYSVWSILSAGVSIKLRWALIGGWAISLLVILLLIGLLISKDEYWIGKQLGALTERVQTWNRWLRTLIFITLIAIPIPLVFTEIDRGLTGKDIFRAALLIPLLLLASIFLPANSLKNYWGRLALTILSAAYLFMVAIYLDQVTTYPFSMSWSEGNRFYDYSLIFGQDLYEHPGTLTIPYFSPGRYALWGVWFLIPDLPIWVHRLWDAILWTLPPLILGWFIAVGLQSRPVRWGVALWVALFLNQGPIYTPLILSAILVAIFLQENRLGPRIVSVAVASFYAGLSRWTWFLAPGVWAILIDLCLFYPKREGAWYRRLAPTVLIGLVGSLSGLLANINRFIAPKTTTLSLSQPLLWYRLLPNATYSPGILQGIAIAVGPVVLFLIWLIASRRWKLDWLQILVVVGALAGTLIAGLIASTKIGGGSNLHNLDMFLVTLVFLVGIYFVQTKSLTPGAWPAWTRVLVTLAILIPSWFVLSQGEPFTLPAEEDIQKALVKMQNKIERAQTRGEVLFMDQRQLLTFGYLEDINLVPEYEKKYVMDQAMAGNAAFFQQFYRDLADQRFSLIVSEPLFTRYQDRSDAFGEENNAWVQWVSRPLLCYYKPSEKLKIVKVYLMVPQEDVTECLEKFPPG